MTHSNSAADYSEYADERGNPYVGLPFYDPDTMTRIYPARNIHARLVAEMYEEGTLPEQYLEQVAAIEDRRREERESARLWLAIFEPAWFARKPLPTNEYGRVLVPWDYRERQALGKTYASVDALCLVLTSGADGVIAPKADPRRLLGKTLSRLDELGVIVRVAADDKEG